MTYYLSLYIYIILVGLLIPKNSRFLSKMYSFFIVVTLTIVVGFRDIIVGNDTLEYYILYQKYGSVANIFSFNTYVEIGFKYLNYILYKINESPVLLTFTTALLFHLALTQSIINKSKTKWFSIALYLSLDLFFFTFSGIRQTIALSLIIISFNYLDRKFLFYFLVLLASTFHVSALVFLIVRLLRNIKFDKKTIYTYVVLSLVIFMATNYILRILFFLFPKYSVYSSSSYLTSGKFGLIAGLLEDLFLYLCVLFLYHRELANNSIFDKKENVLLHLMSISLLVSLISVRFALFSRLNIYFKIFYVMIIPNKLFKRQDKDRLVLGLLILSILTISNLIILKYRPEWYSIIPYKFSKFYP